MNFGFFFLPIFQELEQKNKSLQTETPAHEHFATDSPVKLSSMWLVLISNCSCCATMYSISVPSSQTAESFNCSVFMVACFFPSGLEASPETG